MFRPSLPLEPYPGKNYQPAHAPNVDNSPLPSTSAALNSIVSVESAFGDTIVPPMGLGELEGVEGVERIADNDHVHSVNHHQPDLTDLFPPGPYFPSETSVITVMAAPDSIRTDY